MRETRQSGLEGGVARTCHPYPYYHPAFSEGFQVFLNHSISSRRSSLYV